MFDIDVKGLAEIEGGRPAYRLALEPVANVFDEFRGYGESRRKPSYCAVTIDRSDNPRGWWYTVVDDGPGFLKESDIYTLYGTTAKRSNLGVGGRFNVGEKQLIASAVQSRIDTLIDKKMVRVQFQDGKRHVHRTQYLEPSAELHGTTVSALMRWKGADAIEVRELLSRVLPPNGLTYSIDGQAILRPRPVYTAQCSLPTVRLAEDGVLRPTTCKTTVEVFESEDPWLYELGIPVCGLKDIQFRFSLDVQQKVPVPMSRDMVETAYLYRLIGSVLEQSAMDGRELLKEDDQKSGFVKDALDYVRAPEALAIIVKSLYGDNVVRQSTDPIANAKASQAGATVIPGGWFGEATRKRLDASGAMPTAKVRFGGAESIPGMTPEVRDSVCPRCGGTGKV